MKKVILTLTAIIIVSAASSKAFGQENKKTDDACKSIVEITDEKKLIESRLDADADYKKYKKEAEMKILANQNKIAYLKANRSNNNKYTREEYDKMILDLEQKNNSLRNKIHDSFITKTCAWPEFKVEFDSEMNELQHAIKNLEENNTKLVKE